MSAQPMQNTSFHGFRDRAHAGRLLADAVEQLKPVDPIVVALPRGGVPVAAPVAARLTAPLDVILVRKLGAPGDPELAIGAIVDGERPESFLNEDLIARCGVGPEYIRRETARQREVMESRRAVYLKGRERPGVAGRTVIVIDDGVATGATMQAAVIALRRQHPKRIVLAVPVGAADALERLRHGVDEIICLYTPDHFRGVGMFYDDFRQVSDDEVIELLDAASSSAGAHPKPRNSPDDDSPDDDGRP